jgi:hypothetical protein
MQDRPIPRLPVQRGRGKQLHSDHRHPVNNNNVTLLLLHRCYLAGTSGRQSESVKRKLPAQRNLARRTALDNALADIAMQAAGVEREQTPRERDLERRRQVLNRRSRQEGRREGPYSLTPRPYTPRPRRGRGNPASTRATPLAPDADTRDPTDE